MGHAAAGRRARDHREHDRAGHGRAAGAPGPARRDRATPRTRRVVANAVEELLRYLTIVHSGRRRVALEDMEIGGQLIRAGEGIVVRHRHRQPRRRRRSPTRTRLDVHRKARHHVAFGYGVHQCLGQPLARVELQVVYSTLYRRIPTLALAVPARRAPVQARHARLRGLRVARDLVTKEGSDEEFTVDRDASASAPGQCVLAAPEVFDQRRRGRPRRAAAATTRPPAEHEDVQRGRHGLPGRWRSTWTRT